MWRRMDIYTAAVAISDNWSYNLDRMKARSSTHVCLLRGFQPETLTSSDSTGSHGVVCTCYFVTPTVNLRVNPECP